ncbi:hypothetical protein GCM10023321_79810 [Pseudonocardia eucalypti]|uniref:Uncharacterized protein n=1 Tax=Pseudonocardia eucalypti TaxID=648755 RepID=A0ABP9RCE0_9PSEU|nr:hypothetical protein [Pseudonocardia eucalypti]
MSDDCMIGPGRHEVVAHENLNANLPAAAQVWALLAIASAINRVADQLEELVDPRN